MGQIRTGNQLFLKRAVLGLGLTGSLCLLNGCDLVIRSESKTDQAATPTPAPTPGVPYELSYSGVTTTPATTCTALTITQKDTAGLAATSGSNTSITLGGVAGTYARFYTTSSCATTTTTATITAGQTNTTVYFKDSYVESALTLTASGLTVDASQSMAITGPFALPVTISPATSGIGAGALGLSTIDFDNDGKLDLAVADYWNNKVHVTFGDGAGSFGSGQSIALTGPARVATGSLKGNANKDIVVSRFNAAAGTTNVTVIPGNGDRTFGAAVHYPSTGTKQKAVSIEVSPNLLNSSGYLDVVVAYEGDSSASWAGAGIDVFPGDGTGSLGAATGYATDGIPQGDPAIGDVTGDGQIDFIVPQIGNGNANGQLYRNTGSGFSPVAINAGGGYFATVYAVGFFNADSWLDWSLALSWFGAFVNLSTNGTGGSNYTVAVSDTTMAGAYTRARTGVFTTSGNVDAIFGQAGNNAAELNGLLIYPGNGDGKTDVVAINESGNLFYFQRN